MSHKDGSYDSSWAGMVAYLKMQGHTMCVVRHQYQRYPRCWRLELAGQVPALWVLGGGAAKLMGPRSGLVFPACRASKTAWLTFWMRGSGGRYSADRMTEFSTSSLRLADIDRKSHSMA